MDNGFDIDGIFETFDENMLLDLIDDMRGIIGEKRFSDLVISIAQENSDIDHDDLVYIISDIVDVTYEDYLDLSDGNCTRHGYIDPDDLAGDRVGQIYAIKIGICGKADDGGLIWDDFQRPAFFPWQFDPVIAI